jgi:hypothetical protein
MISYYFAEIVESEIKSIKTLLGFMCKENNINQERQNYKIFFSKEKVFPKNNDLLFTSGSKKTLSFYGKVYLSNNSKILETIYLDNQNLIFEPSSNSILILSGGVNNSTMVKNEEDVTYFYIAPTHLLGLQDPTKWENI